MKTLLVCFSFLLGVLLSSCSSSNQEEESLVSFFITDAPTSDLLEVNIDILSVIYSTPNFAWDTLAMEPTRLNLLDFSNGLDHLLGKAILEDGVKVDRLWLILGNNNTLMLADSTIVPLQTPSGQSSGIQVNVSSNSDVIGCYNIIIDFNADRSIVSLGNDGFILRPVIRAFIEMNSASISGNLTPKVPARVFTVSPGGDTVGTISDIANNNYYLLRGLNKGEYDVMVQDIATGSIEVLESGISVFRGNIDLGLKALPF